MMGIDMTARQHNRPMLVANRFDDHSSLAALRGLCEGECLSCRAEYK